MLKKHGLEELTLPEVSGILKASNMPWGFCNLEHSNRKQTVVKCTCVELPRQLASIPADAVVCDIFTHTGLLVHVRLGRHGGAVLSPTVSETETSSDV